MSGRFQAVSDDDRLNRDWPPWTVIDTTSPCGHGIARSDNGDLLAGFATEADAERWAADRNVADARGEVPSFQYLLDMFVARIEMERAERAARSLANLADRPWFRHSSAL